MLNNEIDTEIEIVKFSICKTSKKITSYRQMIIENYLDIQFPIICILLLAYKSCLAVNLNH